MKPIRLALLASVVSACAAAAPCDDVAGSCLALTLQGKGEVIARFTLDLREGLPSKVGFSNSGPCPLPCQIQLVPPSPLRSSQILNLHIDISSGNKLVKAVRLDGIGWSDGKHIEASVDVGVVQ